MKQLHIHVTNTQDAFIVSKHYINNTSYDESASMRSGYPIYRDNEEYYNYICCLGDRLEINLKEDNTTINIWIDGLKKAEEPKTDNRTMTVLVTLPTGKKMVRTATPGAVWEMLRDGATVERIEVK